MFVRTDRLFLRPAWLEDAPELTRAIGQEAVVRMLVVVPWPYREEHARESIERARPADTPRFMITVPSEGGRIVGGIGLGRDLDAEGHPLGVGYWIEPGSWGRGYAPEALGAVVDVARLFGHRRITAAHFIDNPASARVMVKCGFRPTGRTRTYHSLGRGASVTAVEHALDLGDVEGDYPPHYPAMLQYAA